MPPDRNLKRRVAVSVLIDKLRDRRHEISDPRDNDQIQVEVLDFLVHEVEHHDHSGSGVVQLVGEFVFRVRRVAGHHDPSGP